MLSQVLNIGILPYRYDICLLQQVQLGPRGQTSARVCFAPAYPACLKPRRQTSSGQYGSQKNATGRKVQGW